MSKKVKVETIEEFLARGGTITKVEAKVSEPKVTRSTSPTGGVASMMTLADAEVMFGESKNVKPKVPKAPTINLNDLPEALRLKYLARVTAEVNSDEEIYEESNEEDFQNESDSDPEDNDDGDE